MHFFLLVIFFLLLTPIRADAASFISEFSISGGSGHADDDFVELGNSGSACVSLENWQLFRVTASKSDAGIITLRETSVRKFSKDDAIRPGEAFLWANSRGVYRDIGNTTSTTSLVADNMLILRNEDGDIEDTVSYGIDPRDGTTPFPIPNPRERTAHARTSPEEPWGEHVVPTPTAGEEGPCPKPDPKPEAPRFVRLNEIFPHPKGKDIPSEFIELFNAGDEPVDLSRWYLTDASKSGKFIIPSGTTLAPQNFVVFRRDENLTLSLNDSNETVSLFDDRDTLIDQFSYKKSSENVSLNFTESGWRGSKTPTPGSENLLNNLPTTRERVPKEGYKNIALSFAAQGKDKDRDTLKYVWDFGDGHRSFKENPTHTYKKNGKYTITLTTKDGADEVLETFTLTIKNFKAPKLRIAAFLPNPKGRDTEKGAEWIEIRNESKKQVDLFGYTIATGSKKAVKHRITEHVTVPKGKTARLTRRHAALSLSNQKGVVELRAPDGKRIDRVKYSFPKSIPDGSVYRKEKGGPWTIVPVAPEKESTPAPKPESPLIEIPEQSREGGEEPEESAESVSLNASDDEGSVAPNTYLYATLTTLGTSLILPQFSPAENLPSPTQTSPAPDTSTIIEKTNEILNAWIP